jgi:hypothetical protein
VQELGDAADSRTQAWKTTSHCLKHCPWNTLCARRENEEVCLIKLAAHRFASGHRSNELDPILNAQTNASFLQSLHLLSNTDKPDLNGRCVRLTDCNRLDQNIGTFVKRFQSSDKDDANAGGIVKSGAWA